MSERVWFALFGPACLAMALHACGLLEPAPTAHVAPSPDYSDRRALAASLCRGKILARQQCLMEAYKSQ